MQTSQMMDKSKATSRAMRVANISPIKGNFKIPHQKFNFTLDAEEREMIAKGANMDKEQIWEMLEKKRF